MIIELKIQTDSENTYPEESVVFEFNASTPLVWIKIGTGSHEREVSVDKQEFLAIMSAINTNK